MVELSFVYTLSHSFTRRIARRWSGLKTACHSGALFLARFPPVALGLVPSPALGQDLLFRGFLPQSFKQEAESLSALSALSAFADTR